MSAFTRELDCSGKTLHIKQLYVGDVGCVVWDAALVLAKFLENTSHFPPTPRVPVAAGANGGRGHSGHAVPARRFWEGKKVVDLGSGTGVVGLAVAVLG